MLHTAASAWRAVPDGVTLEDLMQTSDGSSSVATESSFKSIPIRQQLEKPQKLPRAQAEKSA